MSAYILDVFALDEKNVWIVGRRCSLDKSDPWESWLYYFDGTGWTIEYESPRVRGESTSYTIYSVTATDTDHVWLAVSGIFLGTRKSKAN